MRSVPTTLVVVLACLLVVRGATQSVATVVVSGEAQTLHVYAAPRSGTLVVLSSGDLGWAGFVTDLAGFLASHGVAVVGVNTREYLTGFTAVNGSLRSAQVPGDYDTISQEAQRLTGVNPRPVLAGVSEGAGLSVMAAADAQRRDRYAGLIVFGLPATVELGWRPWRDWTTWITKKDPNEPQQSLLGLMPRLSPIPLVMIQSTADEFVPIDEARQLFAAAREPKRMEFIQARNHRFSDKRPEVHELLLGALRWIASIRSQ